MLDRYREIEFPISGWGASEKHYQGGRGRKYQSFEGSQALPASPSDKVKFEF
jgi:hypothetical protein